MSEPVRILLLEDVDSDAEMIERQLRGAGLDIELQQVETEDAYRRALIDFAPDLVLADYTLPSYDGLSALELLHCERPETPFIFVTGTLGEERAIAAVHSGATDYVLKDRLSRLPAAVERALDEAARAAEHRRVDQLLRHRTEELQLLLAQLPGCLWTTDRDLAVTSYSGTGTGLLTEPPGDAVGRRLPELVGHPAGNTIDAHRDALAGHPTSFERWAHDRHWRAVIAPLHNDDPTPIGVVGVAIDDTDAVLAREVLRASEERFRRLADNAQDIIFRLDLGDPIHLEYVSPAVVRMLGYHPDQLRDERRLLTDLVHPDDRDRLQLDDLEKLAEQTSALYRLHHADGSYVWVDQRHSAVRDAQGRIVAIEGVVRDISEQVHAEALLQEALDRERAATERLRRLNALKDAMLSGVSHELRTPLTAISGFVDVLRQRQQQLSDEQQRDLLGRVHRNVRRLTQLLTNLLDVGDVTRAEPVELEKVDTDLERSVRAAIDEVDLGDHPLHLDLSSCHLPVEPSRFQRLVANLVSNAVRHTPAGTPIWVHLYPSESGARLSVEDSGPGVPDEDKLRVFEPFQHGRSSAARAEGAGIGLAVAARDAALHHGRAWIDDRPGGGTVVNVWLPALAPSPPPPRQPARPTGQDDVAQAPEPVSVPSQVGLRDRFLTRLTWAALGAVALFAVLVSDLATTHVGPAVSSVGTLVAAVIAMLACAAAAGRAAPHRRTGWRWLAVGIGLWAAGDFLWLAQELALGEVADLSLSDVAFLTGYPALAVGLLSMVAAEPRVRAQLVLDGMQIGLVAGLLAWIAVLRPLVQAEGTGGLAAGVAIAYPLGGVALLILALLAATACRGPSGWRMAIGMACFVVADSAYAVLSLTDEGYLPGALSDTGWVAGYLFVGLAARAAWAGPSPQAQDTVRPSSLLGFGPTFVAAGLLLGDHVAGGAGTVTVAMTAAIVLLAGYRQHLAVSSERASTRALSEAGARLRQTNEELAASQQLRDHFLTVVAHETAGPLTTIGGVAQILAARWEDIDPEARTQQLAAIGRQTSRLSRLVHDLLIVGRLEQQQLPVQPRKVQLADIAVQLAAEIGADIEQFDVNLPDIAVWVDPDHLLQMLLNLTSNALKYGAPPRQIAATAVNGNVQISVTDYGPGVPPDFVEILFGPFARAEQPPTIQGVGLGLYVVAGLAAINDTTVRYRSVSPTGSCFVLNLPTGDETEANDNEAPKPRHSSQR